MPRLSSLTFVLTFACALAQKPVLSFEGDLYFIPGSMTKDGEAFLISVKSSDNSGFTIYDGNFNVVREFSDPTAGCGYDDTHI